MGSKGETFIFHNIQPNDTDVNLTVDEISFISDHFPDQSKDIHYLFKSKTSINRKTYDQTLVVLTNCFVLCFIPTTSLTKSEPLKLLFSIHISQIRTFTYSQLNTLLIESHKDSISFFTGNVLFFAQILYRNMQLFLSLQPNSQKVIPRCDDTSLFPTLTIPFSPSQKFQFYLYSMCTLNNIKFMQDIVSFFHDKIANASSLIDFALFPKDILQFLKTPIQNTQNNKTKRKTNQENEPQENNKDTSILALLQSIFISMASIQFISGIYCNNLNQPFILQHIAPFIQISQNLRIVSFANCGITDSKELEILRQAFSRNPTIPISYWDFSLNEINDFTPFMDILKISTKPIISLKFECCNLSAINAKTLFTLCASSQAFHSLSELNIIGIQMSNESWNA